MELIENHMVDDEVWRKPSPKRCKYCKQIECICEEEGS